MITSFKDYIKIREGQDIPVPSFGNIHPRSAASTKVRMSDLRKQDIPVPSFGNIHPRSAASTKVRMSDLRKQDVKENHSHRCLNCHRSMFVHADPDLDDFCSEECREEYYEKLKSNAEYDHHNYGFSGQPDTDRLDDPPWKNR